MMILRNWLTALLALAAFMGEVHAQTLRLNTIERLTNGQVLVTAPASAALEQILEASPDLQNWSAKVTAPKNAALAYTNPVGAPPQFYRLRAGAGVPPTQLPDLGGSLNRVFPAPESLNTIQYAPDGKLGFIAWRDRDLIFRERAANGSWTEVVLNPSLPGNVFQMLLTFNFSGPRSDYNFQPSAALLYDSESHPHVFQVTGTAVAHYARDGWGVWGEAERIATPASNGRIEVIEAAFGANDVLHLAALSAGSTRNLTYGSNKNGSWNWTTISTVTDADLTYWAPPFAPRWLSMAVDSGNNAHIAYRSSMDITRDAANHPRARSVLKYATNKGGSWRTNIEVMGTFDVSGEAANGASIAIAGDDKPRIVTWYDERADSGSAQNSALYFHQQDANGNWSGTKILSGADGYVAGDGNKGSGFSPYLRYDNSGRAHIVFLDHAAEHFGGVGQQEYAGNVRHGWWNGTGWSFETIFRQTNPLTQQAVYPAFAMSGNEMAVTVLERGTQWNLSSYPPMSNSSYYFRFFTKPL